MTEMENEANKSIVDRIMDWWQNASTAGKTIILGLIGVWFCFILWLSVIQNGVEQETGETFLPAISESGQPNSETRVHETQSLETTDEDLLAGARKFVIDSNLSVATYSAVEKFFGDSGLIVGRNTNQGINTAVGETRGLSGSFYLDLEKGSPKIIGGELSADLQQLTSVQPHRDDMLKRFWLESNTYPTANFIITEIPTLPPVYKEGTPAVFPLTGILTVRDIQNEVTFDIVATLENNTLEALAVTELKFADFGIDPPNMAGVLQVEPNFKLIVKITAQSEEVSANEK